MEKSIHVRLPEVLAGKLERFAKAEGMNESELVRQALRTYFAQLLREGAELVSQELRAALEAEGVTERNATEWLKRQRQETETAKPPVAVSHL